MQIRQSKLAYIDILAIPKIRPDSVIDYSMHGMLAHHGDDIDAYPNRPDGRKKKPIEPTAEMDGSGAKIQVQLPAE